MKLPGLKRLVKEDFAEEDQELIDKIGFIVNSGFEPLYSALNRGLNINDNLNQQIIDFTVKVNAVGTPIVSTQLRYQLKTICQGIQILRCSPTPQAAPWITWEQNNTSTVIIGNIKGLAANTEYTLRVLLIGA